VLTALTVAQPLGVRAEPAAASPDPARPFDPAATHGVELLGVSLLEFRLYRRERFDPLAPLGECCPPTHTLRVRSWVGPGLLTHATEVAQLCGDLPCWQPGEPGRTTLRVRTDEAARIEIAVQKAVRGRLRGGSCYPREARSGGAAPASAAYGKAARSCAAARRRAPSRSPSRGERALSDWSRGASGSS